MALNYLTVQDVLFLNLRITGKKQPFDTLKLEEAVYYQYASGQSDDLVAQAARFLTGFADKAPFQSGNDACAFAGLLAFLAANGHTLELEDHEAGPWARPLLNDRDKATEAIVERLRADDQHHEAHGVPDWEHICLDVLERFPNTLAAMLEAPAQAT
jgi:prophage maintenance system killer protein